MAIYSYASSKKAMKATRARKSAVKAKAVKAMKAKNIKAMKVARAMKAKKAAKKVMKVMKAKRVTKVAKGRLAKALVLRGSKERTVGRLTKDSLMKNSRGRVVSKRQSAHGKKQYTNIESWIQSVMEARAAFNAKGFVPVNGRSLQGKALYGKAKALWKSKHSIPEPSDELQASDGPIVQDSSKAEEVTSGAATV
eukprot:TRINITY_DN105619_c0_g1_i1.p1 TRINITY_DN105619_c0_g1~~TRINITY_DN105619_c0_g1_i1.p1  ORF type:complete len:222 (+),score=45.67 TRINITY_DN105619_c0_g1_i1:84-668(+)